MSSNPRSPGPVGRFRSIALAAVLAPAALAGSLVPTSSASASELEFPFATGFETADGGTLGGSAEATGDALRLTSATANQAGSWSTDGVFPSDLGIDVLFKYATYGGSGADGFVAYLADGSAKQDVGSGGAGLGYSCAPAASPSGPCTRPGVSGGYVGVGFDEFGNFSNALGNSGPGQRANQIVVRGSGDGTTGYRYISGVASPGGIATGSSAGARDVRITMQPDADGVLRLTVRSNTGPGTPTQVMIDDVAVSGPDQAALPRTLRLGFAGSTGASTNIHEIQGLTVAVPTDLGIDQDLPTQVVAGDALTYSFTASNTGKNDARGSSVTSTVPSSLSAVSWTCAAAGGAQCADESGTGRRIASSVDLPIGASATYTVTGTLDKAATGSFRSTVTVQPPADRSDIEPADNTVASSAAITPNTDVSTLKTAALLPGATSLVPGDEFTYTLVARNDSSSPAADVSVVDPLPQSVSFVSSADGCTAVRRDVTCAAPGDLPGGASRSFTFRARLADTYTGDGADVLNTATAASTTDRDGGTPSKPVPLPAPFEPSAPAGSLSATATSSDLTAGGSVSYRVTLRNSGNVRLDGVGATASIGSTPVCAAATLAPGASTECLSTAPVTQADLDAGKIVQRFVGRASSPSGAAVALGSDTVTTTVAPSVSGTSSVVSDAGSRIVVGQTVGYSSTFTNTGNVTLTGLTAVASLGSAPTCSSAKLAPGESVECEGKYTVTQSDIDRGSIEQTVSATAKTPSGATMTFPDASVQDERGAEVASGTSSVVSDAGSIVVGQEVGYTSTFTNTGNVTLTRLTAVAALGAAPSCSVAKLAPGVSAECVGKYTVTQSDIDRGSIEQAVSATAKSPSGAAMSFPRATVRDIRGPEIATAFVDLQSDAAEDIAVGDVITHTAVIHNTGVVTIRDVVPVSTTDTFDCTPETLAPGESMRCVTTHTVDQADVDGGGIDATVGARGSAPSGAAVTVADASLRDVAVSAPAGEITLGEAEPFALGTPIRLAVELTNAGNVTLHGVHAEATNGALELAPQDAQRRSGPGSGAVDLVPDESLRGTLVLVPTQDDVDAGVITTRVHAVATSPAGDGFDFREVERDLASEDSARGSVALSVASDDLRVGGSAEVRAMITNTGGKTLHRARLTSSAIDGPLDCGSGSIAPAASVECSFRIGDLREGTNRVQVRGTALTPTADLVELVAGSAELVVRPAPAVLAFTGANALLPAVGGLLLLVLGGALVAVRSRGRTTTSRHRAG
jgi:uncharacterized repeat protein (TIGR01451 family)